MDGTVLARYAGNLAPASYVQAEARSSAAGDRYAYLTVDNVEGSFTISESQLFTIPATTTTKTGSYDDFDDNAFDLNNWRSFTSGSANVQEVSESLRLRAEGPGAQTDNNQSALESVGIVRGDVEFDFSTQLGRDNNRGLIELTNGTDYLRLELDSDGAGGVTLQVVASGYAELENAGLQPLSEDTIYHGAFRHTAGGIEVYVDDVRLALYDGSVARNSILRGDVTSAASAPNEQLALYDDFNDNSFDTGLWDAVLGTGPGSQGNAVREQNNRLEISAGGGARGSAHVYSRQSNFNGIKYHLIGLSAGHMGDSRPEGPWDFFVELRRDGLVVKSSVLLYEDQSVLQVNDVTIRTLAGTAHEWDIRPAGNDIEILVDGQLLHTIADQSFNNSGDVRIRVRPVTGETQTIAIDNFQFYTVGEPTEEDRFAEVVLDNVAGSFQITTDPVQVPYDNFNDSLIDFEKWHVVGDVEEKDGRLRLPLFQNHQPVQGYVSTAGQPGGTDLRGFRLNFSRTTNPKNLGDWDIFTRFELSNGTDIIRFSRLHTETLRIETWGGYGNNVVDIPVPTGQIPDGPFEVRERNGNIEVLHNRSVKLMIPNQTVRAGSYFVFRTHGDPLGHTTPDEPEFFDAHIDNLEFYVDPTQPTMALAPAMTKESDTGLSDTDHVTHQQSVNFVWTRASYRSTYQWRVGELDESGSVNYGQWSDPQSETTTNVTVPDVGLYVFSVRPIDADGIAGEAQSRAFVVDRDGPAITDFSPRGGIDRIVSFSNVTFEIDEPIDPSTFTIDEVIRFIGPTGDLMNSLRSTSISGTDLTVHFDEQSTPGTYELVVGPGIYDIAGNAIDQDRDGILGELDDDQFVATVILLPVVADLTGNGFVDFEDLTILLANWNQNVAASQGNLVDPTGTAVNFEDLTVLLAAWTGPGPAASPQAAAAEATSSGVAGESTQDTATSESRIAISAHFDRLGRRDHAALRRAGQANALSASPETPLRRLQAAAIDRAMTDLADFTRLARRSRR